MIYEPSFTAVAVFGVFVAFTLGLSFYLGRRAKSSQGFFAAHGQIPWFVNGIAFAGDYLSAASFLGICGMIAFYGYDGFLYSIGYLAGWIVALFVVAEPLKRLGKFTFADALDAKFQSRGIKLAVGISTLAVSVFYLIPQMVGAGVLVQPLLGLPHWLGVVMVGTIVILIVVTAGMVSTTWVQFLKGSLLVAFSFVLTVMILFRGFQTGQGGIDGHRFRTIPVSTPEGKIWKGGETYTAKDIILPKTDEFRHWTVLEPDAEWRETWRETRFVRIRNEKNGRIRVWHFVNPRFGEHELVETQTITRTNDGRVLVNGEEMGTEKGSPELHPVGYIKHLPMKNFRRLPSGEYATDNLKQLPDGNWGTGSVGPVSFFGILQESTVVLWGRQNVKNADGSTTTVYFQKPTDGSRVLRPGEHPTFNGIRSDNPLDKLNFLSLMLALFCGTASLPHILIRYYTVKDEASARKSTIVGIAAIGFFYVLTLYMGLGAMTSGALDVTNNNMSAPLLARSMSEWLFAAISAIAFTTVLGTVSGLILASAGAVTHDLLTSVAGVRLNDHDKVRVAKIASVVVGAVAIVLGILFKELNVSYLVGWAFSVAASANLPALIMLLFWKKTTRQGIVAAVIVGMASSLGWILLSGDTYSAVYGLPAKDALVPFSQPGIVTIPLGFATLIAVSLLTQKKTVSAVPD